MAQFKEREVGETSREFQRFIESEKIGTSEDVVGVATIALLSLEHSQEEIEKIIAGFSEKTYTQLKAYMQCFSKINIIGTKLGSSILKEIITSDDSAVLGFGRASGFVTNQKGLNKLIVGLHHLNKKDSYIEYGAGIGNGALMATDICKKVTAVDISEKISMITELRAYWFKKKVAVIATDMSQVMTEDYKADKSTVDIGIGRKKSHIGETIHDVLQDYQAVIKPSCSATWYYALMAFLNNQEGRVIAVIERGALNLQADADLRKTLVTKGFVEGIIDLPAKLLYGSGIALSLLILKKGSRSVKLMDASKIFTQGRRINIISDEQVDEIISMYDKGEDKCFTVNFEDIEKKGFILSPSLYNDDEAPTYDGIELGKVCEYIKRGAGMGSKELEEITSQTPTNIRYLQVQNIQDGTITEDLPYLSALDEKYEKFCIENDEVIVSKIPPFKTGLASVKTGEKVLATGNIYMIKIKKDLMDPLFVMLFLRSEAGQKEISRHMTVVTLPTISIKAMNNLLIPNIDKAKQDEIVQKYLSLRDELAELDKKKKEILTQVESLINF